MTPLNTHPGIVARGLRRAFLQAASGLLTAAPAAAWPTGSGHGPGWRGWRSVPAVGQHHRVPDSYW